MCPLGGHLHRLYLPTVVCHLIRVFGIFNLMRFLRCQTSFLARSYRFYFSFLVVQCPVQRALLCGSRSVFMLAGFPRLPFQISTQTHSGVVLALRFHQISCLRYHLFASSAPWLLSSVAYVRLHGIGLLIIQLMLFPSLQKIVGPIFLIRATAVISIPVLTIYPFIAMLKGIQLWIAINVASLIKNILAIMTITGTHVLLNNAVDDDRRATANGLQMSAMSFFKAIGPTGAGVVFSWSQKRQYAAFFPGFHMVCLFLNIVVIIFVFMTLDPILPRSTNKPIANALRNSLHEEEQHAEEQEKHGFS